MSDNDDHKFDPSPKRGMISHPGHLNNPPCNSANSSPNSPYYLYDRARQKAGSISHVALSIYDSNPIIGTSPGTSSGSGFISPSSASLNGDYPSLGGGYTYPATSLSPKVPTNQHSIYENRRRRVYFQSNNEILALAKSNATPNLFAIGGPKTLQLARISETEISIEADLVMQHGRSRNSKFGLISDLKFGYQNFGRNIAASTLSGSIHLYNLDRGSRIQVTFNDHQRAVNSIDFANAAPYRLVSGSQDGKMKIWDLRTRNNQAAITINSNSDAIRCVQFNPRLANVLCCITDSGIVQKWDIRQPSTFQRRLNAHSGPGLALDWHPELDYIVTGGRDKQLQVWNMDSASDYSREPDHVIYTSGPIFKVSWCRGRGNGSILNTDIATCFLNDDPCIQIWTLGRKYVPKRIIECHSNQVTGLLWKSPKYLVSCSKDKKLFQCDVLNEPTVLNNLSPCATAWDPKSCSNMTFIKQSKKDYDQYNQPPKVSSLFRAGLGAGATTTTNSGRTSLSSLRSSTIDALQRPVQSAASFASYINGTSDKMVKRASPSSRRRPSSVVRHNIRSHVSQHTISPSVMPVNMPLPENNSLAFEFLSSHYLHELPLGIDMSDVCDFNAVMAASVNHFRDAQTWKTLRFSVSWDYANNYSVTSLAFRRPVLFKEMKSRPSEQSDVLIDSSKDVKNPHHKRSKRDSADNTSHKVTSNSITSSHGISSSSTIEENVIIDDEEDDNEGDVDNDNANKNGDIENNDDSSSDFKPGTFIGQGLTKPLDIEIPSSTSPPITRNRYSFTGSSVDFDNEKSTSPTSSFIISHSNVLSQIVHPVGTNESKESLIKKVAKGVTKKNQTSKSKLTAILKLPPKENAAYTNGNQTVPEIPWNAKDMVRRAAVYSASQGDILFSATLALLFYPMYPGSITKNQFQEWCLAYHNMLLRRCLFTNAAEVLKSASGMDDIFKTIGQSQTSITLYCNNCHVPIMNDKSREKLKNGVKTVNFGFWYCDRCGTRQGNCAYCNRPIRGMCVALLGCGHKGHFECFKTWFVNEKEKECPACGALVVHCRK